MISLLRPHTVFGARQQLKKAERLLKQPHYIHKPLGIAYSRAGRFWEAYDQLGWTITWFPDDAQAYHEWAAAAFALKERQTVWACEYHLRRLNAKEADDVMRMRLMLSASSPGA